MARAKSFWSLGILVPQLRIDGVRAFCFLKTQNMAQENYYFERSDSPFKNLSEDKLSHLVSLYEGNLTIYEIERDYPEYKSKGLSNHIPYQLSDEICENCGSKIHKKIKRISKQTRETLKYCTDCSHDYTTSCKCKVCIAKRERELELIKIKFEQEWQNEIDTLFQNKTEISDVALYDEFKICLLMQRYFDIESGNLIFPKSSYKYKFNTDDEHYHYFVYLVNRRLIAPVRDFQKIDLYFHQNLQYYIAHDPLNFDWKLNLKQKDLDFNFFNFTHYLEERIISESSKLEIWKEIYRSEVSEYIQFYSQKFLKTRIEDFICDIVTDAIFEDYSLSKSFAIIYYSLSSTLRYSTIHRTSETHLNTHFRNKIMQMAEKFRKEKTFKDFDRPAQMPFTKLNDYIIQNILKIKANYFYLNTKTIFPNLIRETIEN